MKTILNASLLALMCIYMAGCGLKKSIDTNKISLDKNMLDSIKASADTMYSKKYPRTDLVKADYYVNKKDSTITQVMKDGRDSTRQIIIQRKKIRIYTASFYPNGQLIAKYNLDNFGQYNDSSKEYYENGFLKRNGIYKNGFYSGKWKNYDSTGKYINTYHYNNDGQQINTTVE